MKTTKMGRQGDVLFVRCEPPKELEKGGIRQAANQHGKLVLAQGESTLHEHTVEETDAELIALGEQMLLHVTRATATVKTTHIHTGAPLPRHTPKELTEGFYRIVHQRELMPGDIAKTRRVLD